MPDTVKTQKEDIAMPDRAVLYAPITRIDDSKWEVEGVATSEAVDSYGTVFSYEASKKAFQSWIQRTANVREMHDRKAVAKGIGVFFDDDAKQVIVRSRVSRGARDTWLKIQDGVLSGYSVGATNPKWGKIERNGKEYPYLIDYELTELSLVDNASNPDGHGLSLCRADGIVDSTLVDITETEATQVETIADPEIERKGAKISAETKSAIHEARDHALDSAKKMMGTCGCADCMAGSQMLDPDKDGDVDVPGSSLDSDNDAEKTADRIAAMVIERLAAPLTRLQTISGVFARSHKDKEEIDLLPLQRSLQAIETRLATVPDTSILDEVRASVETVRGQVEIIARQPSAGGPVLNGAVYPVDKRLVTDPRVPAQLAPTSQDVQAGLDRMQETGNLDTQMKQLAAAALTIQRMQGRTGA